MQIPVSEAIKKYEIHPGMKNMKNLLGGKNRKFSFIFERRKKSLAEIFKLHRRKLYTNISNLFSLTSII